MEIRKLGPGEKGPAMDLAWRIFQMFQAPDDPPEGAEAFHAYIMDPEIREGLTGYGAFQEETLTGVLAVRDNHISLFFVDSSQHKRGIGRALFHHFLADRGPGTVSVNSSPYAVEVYRHLGFRPTAPEQMTDGIRYTPMRYSQ
ncbi:GNAT family N-acetyltransferase [uncultured Dysosmobacter sp.]|uniref:GNAT family N-acetyltransferase n=1 Tax=uncultured Dysosmobacter sp. TaxID=2591384 RepID=UPI00260B297A|nr:GNAT family N-acetyltransferase [uncultured Dysosmobacter sp.]